MTAWCRALHPALLWALVVFASAILTPPLFGAPNSVQDRAASSWQEPTVPPGTMHRIHQHFSELVETEGFSGAVLIARNSETLLEAGYGLADREMREPVTPETRFNLGSIDKFITRIAVFQLIDAGRLRLDQRVGEILPALPHQAIRELVTLEHLLDMKSGIPLSLNRLLDRREMLRTADDYLELFVDEELRFDPGTRTEYSNGAYALLGKIVEQVSGMHYDDYVRHHITGPAGMIHTGLDAAKTGQGYAIGYTR
jgi:D-alanyl-D-alanine carboxypeptidase